MDATPWISAAVGLIGVAAGALGTAFAMGRRYGKIQTQVENLCNEVGKVKKEVSDLRKDYEEHKVTIADSVREIGQELTEKMTEMTEEIAKCSTNITHAVTQRQHQDVIDRLGRIEGILNGKRFPRPAGQNEGGN